MFKTDRLDIRGLDLGKSDITDSLAQNFSAYTKYYICKTQVSKSESLKVLCGILIEPRTHALHSETIKS